ncbi:Polysaccharide biosynthesis protein [Gracilibacillus ureilyticus]|uniref:Polysaccharide biosynthesis protein n=1 Tax=Gracilibacillus ureilyticus TaxID=531814 RepID=A0A1H9RUB3_9BACI|nr:SDR family NAD(P)-dependent oxidoreductase [Gracilibacillus ureilyticus]SER76237.1 Polysaccharide biosynthesis protein [Gracilibacillus ureilyticus]
MYFQGKKILVIGGTGTIGTSIVQQLLKESPDLIRVFSRDEYKQHQMKLSFSNEEKLQFMIGDVRDYDRVLQAMETIDYVFHVAAMKRVETSEENPLEAVKTNILGTQNVMKAAADQLVKKVVFTSTDKAISPTNTYGATKLIAERMIAANNFEQSTVIASVRFGNVMGSRGSVIPLFKEQILKQKKITVTDLQMTRFMMTLQQATDLTIHALKEAKGGEIFVLKMPVVNLGELADVLIETTCEKHGIDKSTIGIEVTGLRPGEKMYEELMTIDESQFAWELPEMFIIPNNKSTVYENATRAAQSTYSSSSQASISCSELKQMLSKAQLI